MGVKAQHSAKTMLLKVVIPELLPARQSNVRLKAEKQNNLHIQSHSADG